MFSSWPSLRLVAWSTEGYLPRLCSVVAQWANIPMGYDSDWENFNFSFICYNSHDLLPTCYARLQFGIATVVFNRALARKHGLKSSFFFFFRFALVIVIRWFLAQYFSSLFSTTNCLTRILLLFANRKFPGVTTCIYTFTLLCLNGARLVR